VKWTHLLTVIRNQFSLNIKIKFLPLNLELNHPNDPNSFYLYSLRSNPPDGVLLDPFTFFCSLALDEFAYFYDNPFAIS